MIKKIASIILLFITSHASLACDICGCNMSGLYFGFLPMYNNHFIGLKYSQASFSAFIDNDGFYFDDEFSTDTYRKMELIGRFSLSNKVQLRYVIPYMMNNMKGSNQNVAANGLADPILMAYFNLFNTGNDFSRTIMHSMLIGGGVKLPVGENDRQDNNELINRNFQLGSGSLDYLLGLNYTARHNNMGLNIETSYKINTASSQHYRFGNQTNASANLFYYIETPVCSILPFSGIYFEQAAKHKNEEIIEANTGGKATLGTLGVQFFRNKLTVNMQYQKPLKQHFNTDSNANIKGSDRFSVSFLYSFSTGKNQKKDSL